MGSHDTGFLLWLIPAFPLLGFIINGALSLMSADSKQGPERKIAAAAGVLMPALAFIVTVVCAVSLHSYNAALVADSRVFFHLDLWTWIDAGSWSVSVGFLFDNLSALMLLFVTGIGSLICLYSVGYMANDRGLARFFAYLNLFLFSMIMLVLGDNLLMTFLGWEGVGLCSYLLIGFWYHDNENNNAARKAFIVNRIGDLGVLLGVFALIAVMGDSASLTYLGIAEWAQSPEGKALAGSGLVTAAMLFIFFGCTGKSAQVPLFTWLPDAMAGPTPVSALIHAATMVTAGVFLMVRLADVLVLTPTTMHIILIIALITALYAAVVGLVQWDIKKILAYSTVSQLGFMFMAVGVGAFDVALFHVFTHAFFKATLFLGAGSVIHALHHEQDTRRMGGLAKLLPGTFTSMLLGWWAIIGLPLGSGFFSKDLILERVFYGDFGALAYPIALGGALITSIYMTRMMYLVFWSPARPAHGTEHHVEPVPLTMRMPQFILALGAIAVGGFWLLPFPYLENANAFERYLAPIVQPAQEYHAGLRGADTPVAAGAEQASHGGAAVWIKAGLSVIIAVAGVVLARIRFSKGPSNPEVLPLAAGPAGLTFAFDRVYQAAVVRPLMAIAGIIDTLVDRYIINGCVAAIGQVVGFIGSGYQGFQRSRLRSSLAMSVIGVVLILAIVLADLLKGGN